MSILDRDPRGHAGSPLDAVNVDLSSVFYSNPRLPPAYNGNAQNALDYIYAALYPNYKGTVATKAALPLTGNTPNDYYIVNNDGAGNSAGFVWTVLDTAGVWALRYDVTWSLEGIYAETLNRTQYMYVQKQGLTDLDALGAPITGLYAGQKIYGGNLTNQNLTFNANSIDNTGYVQTDNHFRPTANGSIDLGTTTLRWQTGYFATSVLVGTLTLQPGTITDSSGSLSFGSNNLNTTGNITGAIVKGSSLVSAVGVNTLTLVPGTITDSTGALSFGSASLSTTGSLNAGVTTLASGGQTLTFDPSTHQITSSFGTLSFGSNALVTTGSLTANALIITTTISVGNLLLSGNSVQSVNANGNIILNPNGTGFVDIQKQLNTLGQTVTGTIAVTGLITVGNLSFGTNSVSATNVNGSIVLTPNGTGIISASSNIAPTVDNAYSLGLIANRFTSLYIGGGISNGTNSFLVNDLLALRSSVYRDAARTQPAQTGDALFYNSGSGLWLASVPDTEITHGTLSGLVTGDAGHTQFVMLAGRSGGQSVQGGTAASENLIFESTSNITKGKVLTKDTFAPFTTASYSAGWLGTDLGGSANYFRDLYSKGEFRGFRFENLTSLPANSTQNVGRGVYNTTSGKVFIDTGIAWVPAGSSTEKFFSDTVWNGTITTLTVDVSASISEARTGIWQLCDNASNFERIYAKIEAISATQIRITVSPALPAGSYRLIGIN